MSSLSKLHFGYFATYRAEWREARPGIVLPDEVLESFDQEGIHLRSSQFEANRVRQVVTVEDFVSPTLLVQRLKGRLSYVLGKRYADFPKFSTAFYLGSLGQNTRDVVTKYIRGQVDRSDLVDPLYRKRLKELRFMNKSEVRACHTRHRGVYDLFAHVVLVTGGRYRMRPSEAKGVFDALCQGTGALRAEPMEISMMPDHAHLLVRWPQGMSAAELLEGIKVESGRVMGRSVFWNEGGYVGTVGPYSLRVAVRRNWEAGGWERAPGRG